jgi:hypothetical protein
MEVRKGLVYSRQTMLDNIEIDVSSYDVVKVDMVHVTPGFKAKTRCSSYVCLGSSCHTYCQNVNTENQCLYYINIIT